MKPSMFASTNHPAYLDDGIAEAGHGLGQLLLHADRDLLLVREHLRTAWAVAEGQRAGTAADCCAASPVPYVPDQAFS